jgi:hypothetical protein
VSCRVVSCRVVSCRVVSCRVVSCRVVSCRVVSQIATSPIYIYGGGCHIEFKTPIQYRREVVTRSITNNSALTKVAFEFVIPRFALLPYNEFRFSVEPHSGEIEPSQSITVEFVFETRTASSRLGHFWLDIYTLDGPQIDRYMMVYEAQPLQFGSHLKEFTTKQVELQLQIARPLTIGGEGAIFLVEDSKTSIVIKKYIIANDSSNPDLWSFSGDAQESFRREIICYDDLAAISSHPNIVKAIGFCRYPPAVVMEHIDGGSVAALIESGRSLAPTQIYRIMYGVLKALVFLHSNGIIHRYDRQVWRLVYACLCWGFRLTRVCVGVFACMYQRLETRQYPGRCKVPSSQTM